MQAQYVRVRSMLFGSQTHTYTHTHTHTHTLIHTHRLSEWQNKQTIMNLRLTKSSLICWRRDSSSDRVRLPW